MSGTNQIMPRGTSYAQSSSRRSGVKKPALQAPGPQSSLRNSILILSNYSEHLFHLEAQKYPRYPPNPHFSNWLLNLAQRVEDHVLAVVRDIESSDSEKNFAYHDVVEEEMRKTIQEQLHEVMEDRYNVKFPLSIPLLPTIQRQMLGSPNTSSEVSIAPQDKRNLCS